MARGAAASGRKTGLTDWAVCHTPEFLTSTSGGVAVAENKTKATDASVGAYLAAIDDEARRKDCEALADLMTKATKQPPKMWGTSIVGFGSRHYKYDSGREGEMPIVGFSPRKAATVLYGLRSAGDAEEMLAKLGKHTTGKGCVYVKKLADVDHTVLKSMIVKAVAAMRSR